MVKKQVYCRSVMGLTIALKISNGFYMRSELIHSKPAIMLYLFVLIAVIKKVRYARCPLWPMPSLADAQGQSYLIFMRKAILTYFTSDELIKK